MGDLQKKGIDSEILDSILSIKKIDFQKSIPFPENVKFLLEKQCLLIRKTKLNVHLHMNLYIKIYLIIN